MWSAMGIRDHTPHTLSLLCPSASQAPSPSPSQPDGTHLPLAASGGIGRLDLAGGNTRRLDPAGGDIRRLDPAGGGEGRPDPTSNGVERQLLSDRRAGSVGHYG